MNIDGDLRVTTILPFNMLESSKKTKNAESKKQGNRNKAGTFSYRNSAMEGRMAMKASLGQKGGEEVELKIKNKTKGIRPLNFLLIGKHSYASEGKNDKG